MTRETARKITRDREGPIQESILAKLTRMNNLSAFHLGSAYFKVDHDKLSDNQIRSVKRTLKRLIQAKKVVESPYRLRNGKKVYSLTVGAQKRRARKVGGLTIVK